MVLQVNWDSPKGRYVKQMSPCIPVLNIVTDWIDEKHMNGSKYSSNIITEVRQNIELPSFIHPSGKSGGMNRRSYISVITASNLEAKKRLSKRWGKTQFIKR